MGQVEHVLRLAMAQLAPSKQIQKMKKNEKKILTKTFCFGGKPAGKCLYTKSQLIRTKGYKDDQFTKIK